MRLLIAVDDSPWSYAAIEFVAQMRWPTGTEMTVLSATAPMHSRYAFQDFADAPPVLTPELLEQLRQYHEDVAKRHADQLRGACDTVRSAVVTADPREAIVDFAQRNGVDLIVVGSHGRSGLKKLLMGSVSSHVVSHAPCSVLVVKRPDEK